MELNPISSLSFPMPERKIAPQAEGIKGRGNKEPIDKPTKPKDNEIAKNEKPKAKEQNARPSAPDFIPPQLAAIAAQFLRPAETDQILENTQFDLDDASVSLGADSIANGPVAPQLEMPIQLGRPEAWKVPLGLADRLQSGAQDGMKPQFGFAPQPLGKPEGKFDFASISPAFAELSKEAQAALESFSLASFAPDIDLTQEWKEAIPALGPANYPTDELTGDAADLQHWSADVQLWAEPKPQGFPVPMPAAKPESVDQISVEELKKWIANGESMAVEGFNWSQFDATTSSQGADSVDPKTYQAMMEQLAADRLAPPSAEAFDVHRWPKPKPAETAEAADTMNWKHDVAFSPAPPALEPAVEAVEAVDAKTYQSMIEQALAETNALDVQTDFDAVSAAVGTAIEKIELSSDQGATDSIDWTTTELGLAADTANSLDMAAQDQGGDFRNPHPMPHEALAGVGRINAEKAGESNGASSLPPTVSTAILDKVADRLEALAAAKPRNGVTIQLRPHDLGSITMVVKNHGNEVGAELIASNEDVRQALEHGKAHLMKGLEEKGFQVSNLVVADSSAATSAGTQSQQQAQRTIPQPARTLSYREDSESAGQTPVAFQRIAKADGVDYWI